MWTDITPPYLLRSVNIPIGALMAVSTTQSTRTRVAIVGAGVIGLSVGLCLLERYGKEVDVTIMADMFTPDTTSDRAGAVFFASYNLTDTQENIHLYTQRTSGTFHRLKELYECPDVREEIGLSVSPGYTGKTESFRMVDGLFMNEKKLTKDEAASLGPKFGQLEVVFSGSTFFIKGSKYLPWLMKKIRLHGGLIVKRKLQSLDELSAYNVIVNCTGLGARSLVGDLTVFPTRGQTVVVRAPKLKNFFQIHRHQGGNRLYAYLHKDCAILGGTAEPHNWSTIPDPDTTKDILEGCSQVDPCLKDAEVLGTAACLRPTRESGVRLEIEDTGTGPAIVHNYGHGSQGIILSWGCALEAVQLVEKCLRQRGVILTKTRAKL